MIAARRRHQSGGVAQVVGGWAWLRAAGASLVRGRRSCGGAGVKNSVVIFALRVALRVV